MKTLICYLIAVIIAAVFFFSAVYYVSVPIVEYSRSDKTCVDTRYDCKNYPDYYLEIPVGYSVRWVD